MKKSFLKIINLLIASVLSTLGLASSDQVLCMYGAPTGSFEINGSVRNLKSKPLRGIEVEVQDIDDRTLGRAITAEDGSFEIEYQGWPHREVCLIARDVDGKRNGDYRSDTTLVHLDYPKSGWNQGEAKVAKEIVLKYKSERKNRRFEK